MAKTPKYMTRKQDDAMDKKLTKTLNPKQKAQFKKADAKMDKGKKLTAKQDMRLDRQLVNRIKKNTRGR